MKKHIPNFITLLNLTSGAAGLVFIIKGELNIAIYLVFLSGFFDFLDGYAARLLKAYSDIGRSLDSLADIVSFGVLPAIIAYSALSSGKDDVIIMNYLAWSSLLIPAFSAIRLAIFNNDDSQQISFQGLPTPANAFLVVSAVFIYLNGGKLIDINEFVLVIIIVTACFLMVSDIRRFSLKSLNFTRQTRLILLYFLTASLFLIIFLKMEGIFYTILLYILISIILPGKIFG